MEEIVYQGISREEILLMKRLLTEMKNNLLNSKDFKGVDMDTIIEKDMSIGTWEFLVIEYTDGTG